MTKDKTNCICKQGRYLPKLVKNPTCPIHGMTNTKDKTIEKIISLNPNRWLHFVGTEIKLWVNGVRIK